MGGKSYFGKITKNKKSTIPLNLKLDILRRFDNGEKAIDIAKSLHMAPTTIRTIQARDRNKIKEAAKSVTALDATKMTRTRSSLMIKMESLLSIWIENQIAQNIPLSKTIIQAKAKTLYDDIKSKSATTSNEEHFNASHGWFERFKTRSNLHRIALNGESNGSADTIAVDRYKLELKALIHEGGYDPKQVFNVDETSLFWKRLPKSTFISKKENNAPGFKASKDRLTLLLGGNSNGDFKFKPFLIYHSDNRSAMEGCSKDRHPVHWRCNKNAWMTASLFKDWISTCAIPEIKSYCKKENLGFKALILIDNASAHPVYIDEFSENINFAFIPSNITSLIQPMGQGVITSFKSYYLRRIFKLLLNETSGPEKPTMLEFWKKFNIMKAVEIISDSWAEVKTSSMNCAWRKLWPECVDKKLDASSVVEIDDAPTVRQEISALAKENNFDGMDETDIEEILTVDNYELCNEDLIELYSPCADEESQKDDFVVENLEQRQLTSQQLSRAMSLIDDAVEIFLTNDPDSKRSSKVLRAIATSINSYKEIYVEMKTRAVQKTIENFLTIGVPINSHTQC